MAETLDCIDTVYQYNIPLPYGNIPHSDFKTLDCDKFGQANYQKVMEELMVAKGWKTELQEQGYGKLG